jgi:hypothetical protein
MIPPQAWCDFWDEKYTLLQECFRQQANKTRSTLQLHETFPGTKIVMKKIRRQGLPDHITETQADVAVKKMRRCVQRTW